MKKNEDNARRLVVVTENKIISGVSNSLSYRDLVEKPQISHGFTTKTSPGSNLKKLPARFKFNYFKLVDGVLIYDRHDATLRGTDEINVPISNVVFIYGVDDPYETNKGEAFEASRIGGSALAKRVVNLEFVLERFRFKGETEFLTKEFFLDGDVLYFSGFERDFVMLNKPELLNVNRKFHFIKGLESRPQISKFKIGNFDYGIIHITCDCPKLKKVLTKKPIQEFFTLYKNVPLLFSEKHFCLFKGDF